MLLTKYLIRARYLVSVTIYNNPTRCYHHSTPYWWENGGSERLCETFSVI